MTATTLQIPSEELLNDEQLTRVAALVEASKVAKVQPVPAPEVKPLITDTADLLLVAHYILTGTESIPEGM